MVKGLDIPQTGVAGFLRKVSDVSKNVLNIVTILLEIFKSNVLMFFFGGGGSQVLGFLLASFGFVEFFYILLERSQDIQHHMVFLLSPIIRSMTVVSSVTPLYKPATAHIRSKLLIFFYRPIKLIPLLTLPL